MSNTPCPPPISRLRSVFVAALECSTDAERREYVGRLCADDSMLRNRALQMLDAHFNQQGSPLDLVVPSEQGEETVSGPVGATLGVDSANHPTVGRYKLLQKIGEGGMGTVYMAQQTEPIRRKVAFKVIRPGMGSREVIARFEAERQALALMEHPNIARVLDAGATDAGQPFFVMELVNGKPITHYCREGNLPLAERLRLFVDVCQAVQHAHMKGIIHRDLKPSNVMVTVYEGRATVKVIDFGVAKALNQDLTVQTLFTQFSCIVGTPMYMSPEQAELGRLDIDTRSDVYSLGVLLYEVLTGTKPFDQQMLSTVGFDELRRIIREEDPERPSTRLSTMFATASAGAVKDRMQLAQDLRSELDWVVMKALEKNRERRYQSASELARDLTRFLDDEPVDACPPSVGYRVKKFARKHRGTLSGSVIIVTTLLLGLFFTSQSAVRARLAETAALESQAVAVAAAEQQRRRLYESDMLLACDAWWHNDARVLTDRLLRHVPAKGQTDLRGFEWHFLRRSSGVEGRMLIACGSPQYDLALSPNGRELAIAGQDSILRIISRADGGEVASIATGQREINGVAYSPDGARIATVGDDGTLRVYRDQSLQEVFHVQAHTDLAYQVAFSADGRMLVTCGRDQLVGIWDAADGSGLGTLNKHAETLEYLSISSRDLVAAGDRASKVSVWDLGKREVVSEFKSPQGKVVTSLAFSGTNLVAYGTNDGVVYIVDAATGSIVARQRISDGIQSVAFAPNGTWIALGDRNGTLRVMPFENGFWDVESTRVWPAHRGRVYSVTVTSDSQRVISAGDDGRVMEWNPWESPAHTVVDCGHSTEGLDIVDDRSFAVGTHKGIQIFDRTGQSSRMLTVEPGGWQVASASVGGSVFAISARTLVGWNVQTGEEVFRRAANQGDVYWGLTAAADGSLLAVVTRDAEGDFYMEVLDMPSGRSLTRFRVLSAHCRTISSDGRRLVYDSNNEIHVYNLQEGRHENSWLAHQSTINEICLCRGGSRLASISSDRSLKLWSVPDGQLLGSVLAHRTEGLAVAITPEGGRIATSGVDRMLRLWDGETLEAVWEYPPMSGVVRELRFLGDGDRLVGRAGERNVLILDGSKMADEIRAQAGASRGGSDGDGGRGE